MSNNKQRLETLATEVVQRNGLSNLSFRTLGDAAGIKSSSVHYHFPEKSDLAQRLIERYAEEFASQLEEISKSRGGLFRKLSAFIALFEDVQTSDRLCLCGMMAAELEQLSEDNRKVLKQYFVDTEQWLTNLFEQHRTDLNGQLASAQLAKAVLAGLEGALLVDRVVGNGQRLASQKKLFLSLIKSKSTKT